MFNVLGQIVAPIATGALGSYLISKGDSAGTADKIANYQNAINYLNGVSKTPYNGLFGSAGPNGVTTGTGYDEALRRINAAKLAKQIQAERINLARSNMTDADARAAVYSQGVAENTALNNGALNNAARALVGVHGTTNGMKNLYNAAKQDAVRGNQFAYARALNAMANNDANYGNNLAVADAMKQADNYNTNSPKYNELLANLMSNAPVRGASSTNAMLRGALGGLARGIDNYFTYGG